ncbi:retrovirus-related pol polyprotein from transposon TNT 1-94 [Tanacetum coccineum]
MMANLSEDIQSADFDTRPPMLDRSDFEYWKQRIRLYYLGKENGENILQSIDEGPFKMGKFRETLADDALGPEWDRVVKDLTPKEKERYKVDIRATNILLQGLPKDIYTLINHYTDTKDIWDNVKMLLEGYELTRDERESQLYDDFEHFCQNKGETILEYCGRFVTVVKLNRGLKTSNYDQLYAYMKQHEAHANENKMMLEKYTQHAIDPLAFVSNVALQQHPTQSSAIPQSSYVPPGRQNRVQGYNARGAVAAGNEGLQNRIGNANPVVLDEEQLLFNESGQDSTFDDDVDEPLVQDLALNVDQTMFMANLSSADPMYDEAGPSYDSDILSEAAQCISANEQNKVVNESLTAKLTRYKEQVKIYEKRASAMQVQSALYNGHEIVKTNHAFAVLHDSDDTLELAEITRLGMLEKMKSPPVMNAVNTVSRFSEMHDAYTVEQARKTAQDAPEFDSFFEINKIKEQLQGKNNTIRQLKVQISHMNERRSEADHTLDFKALDSQNIKLTEHVTALQEQNEHFRADNEKAWLKGKIECVTMNTVKPKVLAPVMYAIDVEPIPPRNRNNREVHLDYLKHLKESVESIREIVEEARIEKPLDNALNDVVKRRNCTLVEAAQTMLIFSKALMFLWAKAVSTACYTKNRSLIHTRHNKTSYELVHGKKPDLTFLRIFGALCYPTNDNEDL